MTPKLLVLAALAVLAVPATAQNAPVGVIGGGIGGYLTGELVGGRHDRTAKIVRAGIAGVAGTEIGPYMDKQERDLRARTTGTTVQVIRQGDELLLTIPNGANFAYKSVAVAPGFARTLDQVAMVLAAYPSTFIDIYGHTDSVGGDAYNEDLSQRRAASVATYLESRGVQTARVGTKGFGKTQPIVSNETEDGRATNRRVEIRIVPISESELG